MRERTKELIKDETFQREYAANPERDFIRRRKLGALCKARAKIGWEAFREVFEECAALSPVGKLYQGYELLAVDGMKGEMPNLPALKDTYPVNARQSCPMFHAMSAYGPLNETFLTASGEAVMMNSYEPIECPYCLCDKFIKKGFDPNRIRRYKRLLRGQTATAEN